MTKPTHTCITISKKIHAKLKKISQEEKRPISKIIEMWLEEYEKRRRKK